MKEIRCKKCKRLLMKGNILKIEIKCPKCGYIQNFQREKNLKEDTDKEGGKMVYLLRLPP